jgi:hypothetical protein
LLSWLTTDPPSPPNRTDPLTSGDTEILDTFRLSTEVEVVVERPEATLTWGMRRERDKKRKNIFDFINDKSISIKSFLNSIYETIMTTIECPITIEKFKRNEDVKTICGNHLFSYSEHLKADACPVCRQRGKFVNLRDYEGEWPFP